MTNNANESSHIEDEIEMSEAAAEMAEAMDAAANAMDRKDAAEELSLEERFQMLAAENSDLKDRLLRAHAEMENLRKRSERQISEARVYAIEKFAGDMLPVSDNFARAMDALPADARAALSAPGQSLLDGIEATQKELHTILARHGVTAIDAAPGATFDPNAHQAVSQIPSEHPAGTVAMTFQAGWKIGNRTLRAAMVAVSSGKTN